MKFGFFDDAAKEYCITTPYTASTATQSSDVSPDTVIMMYPVISAADFITSRTVLPSGAPLTVPQRQSLTATSADTVWAIPHLTAKKTA